jgi:hypothetical protein
MYPRSSVRAVPFSRESAGTAWDKANKHRKEVREEREDIRLGSTVHVSCMVDNRLEFDPT